MNFLSRFIFILFFFGANLPAGEVGSISFSSNQRFFNDTSLRNVNGQSPWGAVNFQVKSGLSEFFKVEPVVGISFIKNMSSSSLRKFEYQIYSGSIGLRYRPWDYEFFWLTPYLELDAEGHYGRGRIIDLAGSKQKLAHGMDIAFTGGAGVFFSFMYDQQRKDEMDSEWDVHDFGLLAGIHYSRSGFMKRGDLFNVIDNLNYWDFGLGLLIDW